MKTPREILFSRHRSAEPNLDALRQEVLTELSATQAQEQRLEKIPAGIRRSFQEFVGSLRWHLAGLSAAWLLVAVLSFERTPAPAPALAHQGAPPPRQLLIALREHRRQLMELLHPPVPPPPSVPQALLPRRRDEPASTLDIA